MTFEILLNQSGLERLTGPFLRNLKRLGINANMRTVDTSQYTNRTNEFDFDMTITIVPQSSSPGNEQREFFSSESAKAVGSYNVAGISDPVVDELIELLIAAPDRESLEARTRALDRVLLWGFYVVPNYHLTGDRIVYWDKFGHPSTIPARGYQFDTWWIDQAHEATMAKNKAAALLQEKAARENKAPAAQSHMVLYILAAMAGLIVLLIVRRRRRNTGDNS
jgi:microcin C transport system substrate-binding protein